jgi:ethanolamine utilization microcompartment shell protein EutL
MLEKATKELAEPVFERRQLDRGDTAGTLKTAGELAEALAGVSWEEFLASIEGVTIQFLAKYRELVELSTDDTERQIAEAYVAHEVALAAFGQRALGSEPGEPLELILALPHVAATVEV